MERPEVIGIIGGGGFVGSGIVQLLAKKNTIIKVGSRHPEEHLSLKMAATVGKIQLNPCDVRSKESIQSFVKGCDVVINLAGILFEKRRETFQAIHVDGAKMIAEACNEAHVKQLIHISALGIDQPSHSLYARSKAEGEVAVKKNFQDAVILRPSLIFGTDDKFFNKFAAMATLLPFLPVFKGGHTAFQPIYVEDLALAVGAVIDQEIKDKTFELAGPDVFTFRELLEIILDVLGKNPRILALPTLFGYGISFLSKFLSEPLLTRDQLRLLCVDSVASGKLPGVKELGITPKTLLSVLPTYLKRFI